MTDPILAGPARLATFYSAATWIEGRAEDQLAQTATWPGMHAVAGFPDLHPGRYGPVGAAFLADRLYPQLVGPDIGCGMALFRLNLPLRKFRLDKAARRLRALEAPMDHATAQSMLTTAGVAGLSAGGLGSIGGGNHFCEVQIVTEVAAPRIGLSPGDLCLLVHSGSRGAGAAIFAQIEASWSQGFKADSPEGRDYLTLHNAACAWAQLNRHCIALRAGEALRSKVTPICDSPHNHVVPHDGGWLHRKGAAVPDHGLVPLAGSRDSHSFLLACPATQPGALGSVSHGAGRRYDRSAMHGRIPRTKSALAAQTRTRFGGHVLCEDRDLLIEEAAPAYKDARQVAQDLVDHGLAQIAATLEPRLTYKCVREDRP